MKNVLFAIGILLLLGGTARAQSISTGTINEIINAIEGIPGDISFLGNDLKENTRFKVDSAISYAAADWHSGKTSVGEAIPFLSVGSYDYIAAGAAWTTNPVGVSQAVVMDGVRLNAFTRPALTWIFDKATLGNIDRVPLLAYLANASATGVVCGHNFNAGANQKLVINTEGVWTGVEIAVGKGTTLKAEQKTGAIHFKDGTYHLYVR